MSVAAYLNQGHIWVECPFEYKDAVKQVFGYQWDPARKMWRFALDLAVCRELRKVFGSELKVSKALADWAKSEIQHRKELEELASAEGWCPNLAEELPALHAAMASRPYQLVGAAWLARVRSAVLADDPGLGKTVQTMGAVVEAGITGPIVVFAPRSAALVTWPNELRKWLPDDEVTVVTQLAGKKRDVALDAYLDHARAAYEDGRRSWLICNIEMLRVKIPKLPDGRKVSKKPKKDEKGRIIQLPKHPQLFLPKWQAAVLDESQNALVTHTAHYWNQSQQRAGFSLLPVAKGGLKLALSGTPNRGKLINIWGTFNWLRPDYYTSFWKWIDRWFQTSFNGFGTDIGELKDENAFHEEWRTLVLRRTKAEVAPDLPPKRYGGERLSFQNDEDLPAVWLEMTPEQKKLYAQMRREATVNLPGGDLLANGGLAERTRLRQIANSCGVLRVRPTANGDEHRTYEPIAPSNKLNWIVDKLDELGILPRKDEELSDRKVIIASQFTSYINFLHKELAAIGVESFRITGETSAKERQESASRFQEPGGPRVFLLNTKAGGVSLTLDAADDIIIVDETENPDDQEQIEGRAHRISRIHSVMVWYLRSLGSIEEEVARTTAERRSQQFALMDGSRGLEMERV
jgi:SNF2 family DNA or RNA helicase